MIYGHGALRVGVYVSDSGHTTLVITVSQHQLSPDLWKTD